MTESAYNPRYVRYCYAHGVSDPEAMLAQDRERMVGFILWIGEQWRKWGDTVGGLSEFRSDEDHRQFDEWLAEQYPLPTEA